AVLIDRARSSVEFKHQNVTAVMRDMQLPFIDGYKPRSNYQDSLIAEVQRYLGAHPDVREAFDAEAFKLPDSSLIRLATPERFVQPPERGSIVREGPPLPRLPIRFDYPEQDAANRKLGKSGEEFVVELER